MLIYMVSLCVIVVAYPCIQTLSIKYRNELYITFIGIWLFCVLALRHQTVGTDSADYLSLYSSWGRMSWLELLPIANRKDCELGYVWFNKFLFGICQQPRTILIITAFIAIAGLCVFIYENSDIPWLSFLIYVTLGIYLKPFSAFRQAIAMGVVLLSYKYLRQNKFVKFTITIVVASVFHKTALCFWPVYFIQKIKITKIYTGLMIGLDLFFLFFGKKVIVFFAHLTHYNNYIDRIGVGSGTGMLLVHSALLFLSMIVIRREKTEEIDFYMHCLLLSLSINILSLYFGMMDRVMIYYDMILLVSVPKMIGLIKGRTMRNIMSVLLCAGFLAFYLVIICRVDNVSIIPYRFMFS